MTDTITRRTALAGAVTLPLAPAAAVAQGATPNVNPGAKRVNAPAG